MKTAFCLLAGLMGAQAFLAPAPKFTRSRGTVKASVSDMIGYVKRK